jgi:SAM-dependent methyltransferase
MSTAVRLQRESDYWDAAHTGDVRTPARRFYAIGEARDRRYRDWVREAGAGPGRRALELGACLAGAGLDLARSGTDVTAIDISPATVEQARANAAALGLEDRMDLRVMDAEELDFPDGTFDVVCASAVIHHLDLDRAVPEIVRVLRPDGEAIFAEPLGHNPLINRYRRRTPEMRTPDEHPLTMEDLDLLGRHFGTVEAAWFHLTSLAAVPLAGTGAFAPVLAGLERLDRALFRLPSLRRAAWYVVLRLADPRTPGSSPAKPRREP